MQLGQVIGSVVSTRKDERMRGHKLLIVAPLVASNGELVPKDTGSLVSTDLVDAGRGDIVLIVGGSTAKTAIGDPNAPIDACIIGIVDSVDL